MSTHLHRSTSLARRNPLRLTALIRSFLGSVESRICAAWAMPGVRYSKQDLVDDIFDVTTRAAWSRSMCCSSAMEDSTARSWRS